MVYWEIGDIKPQRGHSHPARKIAHSRNRQIPGLILVVEGKQHRLSGGDFVLRNIF